MWYRRWCSAWPSAICSKGCRSTSTSLLRPWYSGGFFGLLNPFGLLAGLVSLAMILLQGAVWLQLRADQPIAARARAAAQWLSPILILAFSIAGLWLFLDINGFRILSQPALDALPNPLGKQVEIAPGAWLDNYRHYPLTLAFPALGLMGAAGAWLLTRVDRPGLGLVASSLAQAGVILTAGAAMFPFILPSSTNPNSSLTLWDASSSHLTLTVMFWAAVIFVPIILAYTTWTYAKMWRRVTVQEIRDQEHLAY